MREIWYNNFRCWIGTYVCHNRRVQHSYVPNALMHFAPRMSTSKRDDSTRNIQAFRNTLTSPMFAFVVFTSDAFIRWFYAPTRTWQHLLNHAQWSATMSTSLFRERNMWNTPNWLPIIPKIETDAHGMFSMTEFSHFAARHSRRPDRYKLILGKTKVCAHWKKHSKILNLRVY